MLRTLLIAALSFTVAASDLSAKDTAHCPPGLAKKSPACVPPGQAKKDHRKDRDREVYRDDRDHRYRQGDRITREYIVIRDPYRYGLNRGATYVQVGNYVYRIDRETREVLDLIGAVSAILN